MAYTARESMVISQPFATNSTTQNFPLGTIVRGTDSTYGAGEFIYLKGVASTVVGSIVEYNAAFQTALNTVALLTPKPLAIAMSACVAGEYGWYQISGNAIVQKSTATVSFAAGADVGSSAGLAIAVVTGLNIDGASVATVSTGSAGVTTVNVMINRPNATGSQDEG